MDEVAKVAELVRLWEEVFGPDNAPVPCVEIVPDYVVRCGDCGGVVDMGAKRCTECGRS